MSWSDEEIEKTFRDAYSSKDAPVYQESYFDEIEALLPRQKRKFGIYWIFSGIMFLGIILAGANNLMLKSNVNDLLAIEQKSTIDDSKQRTSNEKNGVDSNKEKNSAFKKSNSKETAKRIEDVVKIDNPTKKSFARNTESNSKNVLNSEYEIETVNGEVKTLNSNFVINTISENEINVWNEVEEKDNTLSNTNNLLKKEEEFNRIEIGLIPFTKLSNPFLLSYDFQPEYLNLPFASKRNSYFIEAGIGLSESFINIENKTEKAMPLFSLGAGYEINRSNYSFDFGINLMNYKTNEIATERSSKVYGLGVDKYSQRINYQYISTLELPFNLNRKINSHKFGLGLVPSITLGSIADFYKEKNGEVVEDQKYIGEMTGLRNFGLKAQVNYALVFPAKVEFGVRFGANLLQMMEVEEENTQNKRNIFFGQISIRKKF